MDSTISSISSRLGQVFNTLITPAPSAENDGNGESGGAAQTQRPVMREPGVGEQLDFYA